MTRRKRKHPLIKEEILDKALEIIDADGLSALSMRRLGAALKIDPMMIYRHFPNKEALLDLTLEHMRSGMVLDDLPDAPSDFLEAVFVAYMGLLSSHPNMLPLAMRRPEKTGISGIQYIIDQGIPMNKAVNLFQSLIAFSVGYAFVRSSTTLGTYDGVSEGITRKLNDWTDENFRKSLRAMIGEYLI